MKTALLIFLIGTLLAAAVSYTVKPVDTPKKKPCGVNEVSVQCQPCEQYCNEEPMFCPAICTVGDYCRCESGYYRASRTDSTCVSAKQCSSLIKPKCEKSSKKY